MSPQTFLLTGISGFTGHAVARALLAAGHRVHGIIRPGSDLQLLKPLISQLTLHEYTGPADELARIVAAASPATIIHLASMQQVEHSLNDIGTMIDSNITFPTRLVEAALQNGCTRLINTSSFWQHYLGNEQRPTNLYAASKSSFEKILDYYTDARGLQAISLMLFDTYGPGDPRGKIISLLLRIAATGEALDMSPGEQLIDLTHIDDVARAYLLAAEQFDHWPAAGHRHYGVASGNPMPLKQLIERFEQARQVQLKINWGKRPYRNREVMTIWDRYSLLPGWTTQIPLETGLAAL